MRYFWNLTEGMRPPEPAPGIYAQICADSAHVYDEWYGPLVCARCGHDLSRPQRSWWRRLLGVR